MVSTPSPQSCTQGARAWLSHTLPPPHTGADARRPAFHGPLVTAAVPQQAGAAVPRPGATPNIHPRPPSRCPSG